MVANVTGINTRLGSRVFMSSLLIRAVTIYVVAAALGCSPMMHAQTASRCPGNAKLTLKQITDLIGDNIPDDRIVDLVNSCHVRFVLSVSDLDHLTAVGTSAQVMDAINRETTRSLTVEQARSEVTTLQHHLAIGEDGLVTERDSALKKLDDDYQAKELITSQIAPKGEFETTAAYENRKSRLSDALAALKRKHDTDRLALISRFDNPLEERVLLLKQNLYPAVGVASYGSYNADRQRLIVFLDGEEYWFADVSPDIGKAFKDNLKTARVAQPFDDNGTRVLVLDTPDYSVSGRTHAVIQRSLQPMLEMASQDITNNNFAGAIAIYKQVLAIDETTVAAIDGQTRAAQAEADAKLNADRAVADLQIKKATDWKNGYLHDDATGLTWPTRDNGARVDWKAASDYCSNLRTGGFSDWRLPTTTELQTLYDVRSARNTVPTVIAENWYAPDTRQTEVLQRGTYWVYHVADNITLSGIGAWSAEKLKAEFAFIHYANAFLFSRGQVTPFLSDNKHYFTALCVRGPS